MIEIPRVVAQRYRAVLRTSVMEGRRDWPLVLCRAGPHGLTLEARQGDISVRHEVAGAYAPEAIAFRACVLAQIEGRTESPVGLEQVAVGKGIALWTDGNEARTVEFDTVVPEGVPCLPKLPRRLAAQPAEFIRALGEAARTTARNAVRLALSRLQLRGQQGSLVSTDGRQLLVQWGFRLPWSAPLLVPRVPGFGLRDLVADGDVVGVGTADGHVAIRAGPWLFLLAVDTTNRFPDVDTVIPKEAAVRSRLRLDPADAASLAAGLSKLPGGGESHAPVTLDLNCSACVRAREGPSGPAAELPLLRSTVSGPPVRLCTDRRLLGRALDLGFREIHIVKPDSPLLCRDETRVFVWMPLDATEAIPLQPEAQHANAASDPAPPSAPLPRKRKPAMPTPPSKPSTPDADNGAGHERNDMLDLVAEVDSLRALLQEAATRAGRLAATLKQQRRQSRALEAAVSALRQLRLNP